MRTTISATLMLLLTLLGCSKDDSSTVTVDETLHAPTGVTASRIGLTAVRISWSDNNETEEGYIVERQTGQGRFVQQVFAPQDEVTVVDSLGLTVNSTYSYRVRAIRYSERGDYSPIATINLSLPYP